MDTTPYRVLVVDDQPHQLLLVEAFLEVLGCEVLTAGGGFECLDVVEAQPPDLILLDVMMPKIDGIAVCRQLKAHKDYRHIPIVLLTALESSEHRVAGIEAGADDFISKPFNRHELLARVKSLLRVKRLAEAERTYLRHTLERYVDASVAQELLDSTELAVPGGRRVDASVLFTDVRGFSSWSEAQAPEAVVEVTNLFLAAAIEAVFRHGGAVDKFTGDGLMALFGAPVAHLDHPRCAVAAALDIVREARRIVHPALAQPLRVGCGVNSDEMVVGNIGSERRLDYTAMGDAVNVARRLCDEAAGGQVLATEATVARICDAEVHDIGPLSLRNRQEPVHTFAVSALGQETESTALARSGAIGRNGAAMLAPRAAMATPSELLAGVHRADSPPRRRRSG